MKGKRKILEETRHDILDDEEQNIDDTLTQQINYLLDQRQRLRDGARRSNNPKRTSKSKTKSNDTHEHEEPTLASMTRPRKATNLQSVPGFYTERSTEQPYDQEQWSQVLGRKQRKRERRAVSSQRPQPTKTKDPLKHKQSRRRPPKTAAVVILNKDN